MWRIEPEYLFINPQKTITSRTYVTRTLEKKGKGRSANVKRSGTIEGKRVSTALTSYSAKSIFHPWSSSLASIPFFQTVTYSEFSTFFAELQHFHVTWCEWWLGHQRSIQNDLPKRWCLNGPRDWMGGGQCSPPLLRPLQRRAILTSTNIGWAIFPLRPLHALVRSICFSGLNLFST